MRTVISTCVSHHCHHHHRHDHFYLHDQHTRDHHHNNHHNHHHLVGGRGETSFEADDPGLPVEGNILYFDHLVKEAETN